MQAISFKVGSHSYRADPLSVFDAFDVSRRLSPIFTLFAMQKDRSKIEAGFARAFTTATVGMERVDTESVLRICLSCVSRNQSGAAFAPLMVDGQMMFRDIDMPAMLAIVWKVLEANRIVDFFDDPALVSNQGAGDQTSIMSRSATAPTG